jgi:hypothetical protein
MTVSISQHFPEDIYDPVASYRILHSPLPTSISLNRDQEQQQGPP